MGKKKFDLSKDLIVEDTVTKIEEKPVAVNNINEQEKNKENGSEKMISLTLRVPEIKHKEFKLWCVQNSLGMGEAFVKMFEFYSSDKK
jgi:hypothetical protein